MCIGEGCSPMNAFDDSSQIPRNYRTKTVPVCVVASSERGVQIGEQPLTNEQQNQTATQLDPVGGSYT